jgi:DNA-binding transcriptional LysR family regulator
VGVALIPAAVLDTYTERARLSVHKLKGEYRSVQTLMIWRKETPQPKVRAMASLLQEVQRK